MIELEAVGKRGAGNRIVTDAPYVLIGRSPASNLVVPDPRVSWHHGEIVFRDHQYLYFDLRSTHGSQLRRGGVDRPVQATRLKAGDIILLAGEDNALQVNSIAPDEAVRDDVAMTISGVLGPFDRAAEDLFIDDAAALRAFLSLERAFGRGDEIGRAGILQALIEGLNTLYPELDYAAVLEERSGEIKLEQSLSLATRTAPRKSRKIREMTREHLEGFVFEVSGTSVVAGHGPGRADLSDRSATIEHDTSGICIPFRSSKSHRYYVQIERPSHHGKFGNRELVLVRAMTYRTEERIRHLDINQRYHAASQNAALGIFAQTLAHDIKNALTFAPYLHEKLADTKKHPDIVRGVETAYQLARCLQSPSRSDARAMADFSLSKLLDSIAQSFSSLFENRCRFESICESSHERIVGYSHLLYRTIWNLVINAYNAHENNDRVPRGERFIRLLISSDAEDEVTIVVEDNAGGMPEDLLMFFRRSFGMIRDACDREADILSVVETMKMQEGAVNRVGLFFTAIAVNDMHGRLMIDSVADSGTSFRIAVPIKIDRLRGLLQF